MRSCVSTGHGRWFSCIFIFTFCTLLIRVFVWESNFLNWVTWSSLSWFWVCWPVIHQVSCCWVFTVSYWFIGLGFRFVSWVEGSIVWEINFLLLISVPFPLTQSPYTLTDWTPPPYSPTAQSSPISDAIPEQVHSSVHGTCLISIIFFPNAAYATTPFPCFPSDYFPCTISVNIRLFCNNPPTPHTIMIVFDIPGIIFSINWTKVVCCSTMLRFDASLIRVLTAVTSSIVCASHSIALSIGSHLSACLSTSMPSGICSHRNPHCHLICFVNPCLTYSFVIMSIQLLFSLSFYFNSLFYLSFIHFF